jgi:hypothetical protein
MSVATKMVGGAPSGKLAARTPHCSLPSTPAMTVHSQLVAITNTNSPTSFIFLAALPSPDG